MGFGEQLSVLMKLFEGLDLGPLEGVRPVLCCCHCGYSYKGRGVYADHNFARWNLEQHERACLRKRMLAEERASRKTRMSQATAKPLPGQLPLPSIDGVVEVPR